MPAMTKIVNIRTRVAVKTVNPPICGTAKGIVMTTGDILKCLCKRAQVEEVLPDGRTVKLNMSNYYTDNGAGLDAKNNLPATKKKPVENPTRFKVPVAPEAQVVETKTEEKLIEESVPADNTVNIENEPDVKSAFVTGMCIADEAISEKSDSDESVTVSVTEDITDIETTVDIDTNTNPNNSNRKKNKNRK